MKTANAASDLFRFDLDFCGGGEAAGADEAGRGCLAGPLVVSAVVFDYSRLDLDGEGLLAAKLADSKKLSAKTREELYPSIIRAAARVSVVLAGNRTIDRDGLHRTNLKALCDCLEGISPCSGPMLVDGRQELADCPVPHIPVKGGDGKSACIAAASIIAKVTRDHVMRRLHDVYPDYGFDSHVGYATPAHKEAIARHGFLPIHRRSFRITLPGG